MPSRRSILRGGLGAAALGLLRSRGLAGFAPAARQGLCPDTGALPLAHSHPVAQVPWQPDSVLVEGLPFSRWYTGDLFRNQEIPFHGSPSCSGGTPPPPTEEVDIAIVGGGISGLATAYLLRDLRPVLFELRPRFGGAAQGEHWGRTSYSLGNAYVITPDPGSFLDELYRELRLPDVVRVDEGDSEVELGGRILTSVFDAPAQTPELRAAFRRYRQIVRHYAEEAYPEIPTLPVGDPTGILALDRKTLKQDIEERMGGPVPEPLAGAIQAYCYSSFAAGWEEISAASGWNFLAAEEYGRWVFPGGTSYMARQLFSALARLEDGLPPGCRPKHLRGDCNVIDVRLVPGARVQVTWLDGAGICRSLLAKKVVMACPKLSAKHVLHDIDALDGEKQAAMYALEYRAYLVANVLLDARVPLDFYDIFLHLGPKYPASQAEAQAHSRVADLLNGHYARPQDIEQGVLTLYWPLPFDFGRWTLLHGDGFENYSRAIAPQVREMLELLGVPDSAVCQVRMTRWGHAMPIARPGLIADGTAERLRRPIEERIFFVNQDNWALPAVENCLLDAEIYLPRVRAGL